jgi:hypothetical protein
VEHPCKFIFVGYLFLILCSVLALTFGYFELDEIHERDYLVRDDPKVLEWDKLQVAEEYLQTDGDGTVPLRVTSPDKSNPVLIFKHK